MPLRPNEVTAEQAIATLGISLIDRAKPKYGYPGWFAMLFASAGVFHHAGMKIPYFAFFAHDSGKRPEEAPRHMLIAMMVAARFFLRSQRGSHQRYRHADGRRVTVSFHHPSDTFRPKTLRRMIEEQARWTEDDLKRLGLIR